MKIIITGLETGHKYHGPFIDHEHQSSNFEIGDWWVADLDMSLVRQSDALRMVNMFMDKFGWTGTFFTREDAERVLVNITGDDDKELSDEAWEYIKNSGPWKYIAEENGENGSNLVYEAVYEAIAKVAK